MGCRGYRGWNAYITKGNFYGNMYFMDITKYMHMKNRHCSHILLTWTSCIVPLGTERQIDTIQTVKLIISTYNLRFNINIIQANRINSSTEGFAPVSYTLLVSEIYNIQHVIYTYANVKMQNWCLYQAVH